MTSSQSARPDLPRRVHASADVGTLCGMLAPWKQRARVTGTVTLAMSHAELVALREVPAFLDFAGE